MLSLLKRRLLSSSSAAIANAAGSSTGMEFHAKVLKCHTAGEIEQVVTSAREEDFTPRTVTSCFAQLARTKSTDPAAARILHKACMRGGKRDAMFFTPLQLSMIALSIAKGGLLEARIPDLVLAGIYAEDFSRASPLALTNTLCALAKIVPQSPQAAQDIARLDLGNKLLEEAGKMDLGKFSIYNLAKFAWSVAKLDLGPRDDGRFVERLERKFAQHPRLTRLPTKDMAIVLASLAQLGAKSGGDLFIQFGRDCMSRKRMEDIPLLHDEVRHDLETCERDTLLQIAYAYSQQCPDTVSSKSVIRHMLDLIQQQVLRLGLASFSVRDSVLLLSAFACARFKSERFCHEFGEDVVKQYRLADLTTRELSTVFHSFALLRHQPERRILQTLLEELHKRPVAVACDETTACTLWSLACLDLLSLSAVKRYFNLVLDPAVAEAASRPSKQMTHQLFQAKLAWKQVHGTDAALIESLLANKTCLEALQREARRMEFDYTEAQIEFGQVVLQSFADAELGVSLTEHGAITADVYIPSRRAVILLVYADDLYVNDAAATKFSGQFALRQRLLEKDGYVVLTMPAARFMRQSERERVLAVKTLARSLGN